MFTLYVSQDKTGRQRYDVGSILCLNLVKHVGDSATISIQECSRRMPSRPDWLVGTPTLVNEKSGEVLRGTEAITFLQHMALQEAEQRGMDYSQKRSSDAKTKRGTMSKPGVQLRPEEPRTTNAGDDDVMEQTADGVGGLWESTIDEDDENDPQPDEKKLGADDLARAAQSRRPSPQTGAENSAPPLPPLND